MNHQRHATGDAMRNLILAFMALTVLIVLGGAMVIMALSAPWWVTAWLALFLAGLAYVWINENE
jgi:hypothetical protein